MLCAFCAAQTDVEERDDSFLTENAKNFTIMDVKMPFYQIAVDCNNFQPVTFRDGGTAAFRNLLISQMQPYLDNADYTLKGPFSVTFDVAASGDITNFRGSPKVPNSEFFYADVKAVLQTLKSKILPAKCASEPVNSTIKIKMEFTPDAVDY